LRRSPGPRTSSRARRPNPERAAGVELLDERGEFVADRRQTVGHLDGIDVDHGELAVGDVLVEGVSLFGRAVDDPIAALL